MSSTKTQDAHKGLEPPMYLQRPSPAHSQDVRHILARTFRDLYTREPVSSDTVKNLQISKGSDDPYHEHYVESLLKVNTEWQQRMDEIAMLERHIMQAQARAMSADERELNKASMSCDNYKELGLPPVRAHFRSCIDTQLLRDHNLLTPSDYLVPDPLPVSVPKDSKIPDYARETMSSRQHCHPDKVKPESSPSHMTEKSLEFQMSLSDGEIQDDIKKQKKKTEKQATFQKKNGWKEFLSEEQREADRKYLDMLQAKANFTRNPRHIPFSVPHNWRSLLKAPDKKSKLTGIKQKPPSIDDNVIVFVPFPAVVEFTNYKVGEVYEITLELKNMSTVMRQCRVLPPSSNAFSIGLGQFPGDSGLVAPGMSCTYGIRFTPYSLRNYDDYISVQMQTKRPLVIPLKARRPPPVLTLPSEVDIGSCLVGGVQSVQLLLKNEGGCGKFCIMPRHKWPTLNIRSILPHVMKTTIKQPPFEIYPATFELDSGQSIALEVIFSPQSEKTFVQEMTLACDNCNISHFKLKGEGEIARVSLVHVELGLAEPLPGEFIDVSTKNLVKFEDLNPFTYTERLVKVSNCTKTELYYQWMVYKPILTSCFSEGQCGNNSEEERVPDLQSAFSVFPSNGVLQPSQIAEFRLTFAPAAEGTFHSIVHMLLQSSLPPQRTGMSVSNRRMITYDIEEQLQEDNYNIFDTGDLPFKDITALGLEMKGKCVPLNVVLHPYALIIQAPVMRGSTVKKVFTMANHSYSGITFRWESYIESYIIEIVPPFGDLEPGMAMDLEINVTGVQPGRITHTMLCHIMNMVEPLHFLVQADFKGPELKIEQPSINFGLVRVGQCETRKMTIINTSEIVVKFTVKDCPCLGAVESDDPDVSNGLTISETSGELQPFGRKTVTLTLKPKCAQSIRRICLLQYEGDQTCSAGVYGEAQNPVVCFLECQQFLPEVYLGVPTVFTVVLHNQTLLPTTFKWGKAEGPQCDDCKVEVLEEEGTILSWQHKEVSLAFTPLKQVSFSEVLLPCHIAGQDDDIYINISCNVKTLAVSYSVSTDGHQLLESMQLNFGEKVGLGETVKRYVHVSNLTAISAPYSVTVEHFVAPPVPLPLARDIDTVASRPRSLLNRTPVFGATVAKATAKINQDYSKLILSKKAGAAFVVHPTSGKLKPFSTQIFEISAYNDHWGDYRDNLIFKVGDLEEVKISMSLNVVGCPLSFQLTGGLPGQEAIVRFGSRVAGSNPITRKLKINNPSPCDIRVDWQVFKKVDLSDKVVDFITYFGRAFPQRDIFGTTISVTDSSASSSSLEITQSNLETTRFNSSRHTDSKASSLTCNEQLKVVSCCLRPHNGVRIKSPISMKPSQMVIPAGGSCNADFTFTPLSTSEVSTEMEFLGYAEGFLSLDNEDVNSKKVVRPEAYHAEQLKLDFSAHLKPALLTVEELEEDGMRFMAAMSDVVKDNEIQSGSLHTCSIKMTNDTLTALTFKLTVNEPFLLVDLDPSSTPQANDWAMETVFCTLKPRHYLVSKVAFRVSLSLLHDTLTHDEESLTESDRKLNFEDVLTMTFLNGAEQKVPLYATVIIPKIEVSDEFLDFGICLVGQTRELHCYIYNTAASHCYWNICFESKSDTCDNDTFQVQPKKGMLEACITHVSQSKATVKVFFTAKHSESYDCTIIVQGMLGEKPRRIVIVGQGSYDGKHEAILDV